MSRQKTLVNKTNIPEQRNEKIARCFYPDIVRDFMKVDIQREFAEWQAEQAAKKAALKLDKTNSGGYRRSSSLRCYSWCFLLRKPLGFDSGRIGQPLGK